MGVSVNTVIVLSWTIFSCVSGMLAQEMSSYVELLGFVEAHDVVWSVLTFSNTFCEWDCS